MVKKVMACCGESREDDDLQEWKDKLSKLTTVLKEKRDLMDEAGNDFGDVDLVRADEEALAALADEFKIKNDQIEVSFFRW